MRQLCRSILPFAALAAALAAAGCNGTVGAIEPALSAATDEKPAAGSRKIGKPYKVGGRWYHPKEDEDYDETGKASWYGPKFHGKRTANGERFNQHAMTAAHPTLPLPSYVRVTSVKTGKAAVVRVNDRGPFHGKRIIDVSKAVAEELGFRRAGSTKVRVEYLGPAEVGGGEKETKLAAAKFGAQSDGRLGRYLGFGRGKKADEAASEAVEVRLASAEPMPVSEPLPGVVMPRSIAPRPEADATLTAYRAEDEDDGAIDALITMNGEDDEVDAIIPEPEPQPAVPLPAQALEASGQRVMGAHDLFAAIDHTAGGSGELNGAE